MIRVLALYPKTPGSRFDMDYYLNKHVPAAEQVLRSLGAEQITIDRGLDGPAGPAPYAVIFHMTFASTEAFQKALAEAGPGLMADIPNYTDVALQLQVSEVLR